MTTENEPREYTEEEVKERFLRHVKSLVQEYEAKKLSSLGKLEGLAFSILAAIDGEAAGLPKFILAPDPHPTDKGYNIGQRKNYYPENHGSGVKCDLSGSLHEKLDEYQREE